MKNVCKKKEEEKEKVGLRESRGKICEERGKEVREGRWAKKGWNMREKKDTGKMNGMRTYLEGERKRVKTKTGRGEI